MIFTCCLTYKTQTRGNINACMADRRPHHIHPVRNRMLPIRLLWCENNRTANRKAGGVSNNRLCRCWETHTCFSKHATALILGNTCIFFGHGNIEMHHYGRWQSAKWLETICSLDIITQECFMVPPARLPSVGGQFSGVIIFLWGIWKPSANICPAQNNLFVLLEKYDFKMCVAMSEVRPQCWSKGWGMISGWIQSPKIIVKRGIFFDIYLN